jgi:hypothetical protein
MIANGIKTGLLFQCAPGLSDNSVAQTSGTPIKKLVPVHGAGADGSGWKGVYHILVEDGFNVSIVQEPETSSGRRCRNKTRHCATRRAVPDQSVILPLSTCTADALQKTAIQSYSGARERASCKRARTNSWPEWVTGPRWIRHHRRVAEVTSRSRLPGKPETNSVARSSQFEPSINGIWTQSPGNVSPSNNDAASAPAAEMYFTAGPNHGSGGLFAYLTAVATDLTEGNSQ